MSFWNTDNPLKPTGIKDPDAILDYPIDFSACVIIAIVPLPNG